MKKGMFVLTLLEALLLCRLFFRPKNVKVQNYWFALMLWLHGSTCFEKKAYSVGIFWIPSLVWWLEYKILKCYDSIYYATSCFSFIFDLLSQKVCARLVLPKQESLFLSIHQILESSKFKYMYRYSDFHYTCFNHIVFIRKRRFTDTANFTLRCGVCQIGVIGQKVNFW